MAYVNPPLDLTLPEYYLENNYIENKIAEIRRAIDECDGDADAFIFISDMHWENNAHRSPALIKYISERVEIPRLFNGGDDFHVGMRPYAHEALAAAFNGDIYAACGNHEYVFGVTGEEVRDIVDVKGENVVFGDKLRNYYYVENEAQKTRYIVLNGWKPQNGDEKWRAVSGLDEAQRAWLENTALDTPEEWTILIFLHCLFSIPSVLDKVRVMSEFEFDKTVNILENYRGKGTIAAVIQGHTHRDRITNIGDIPVLITTSDQPKAWTEPGGVPDINVDRSLGTVNEQSFDVCVLNKKARKITAIRIGGKAKDNDGNECESRVITY